VYELPANVSRDMVRFYFENAKRSNGGEITRLDDHLDEAGYCILTFKLHTGTVSWVLFPWKVELVQNAGKNRSTTVLFINCIQFLICLNVH